MMGAVQPFISGAISKTVNLPNDAHGRRRRRRLRRRRGSTASRRSPSTATARRRCSRSRPRTSDDERAASSRPRRTPIRRKMSDTRNSITHKFSIEGHDGYITVGLYDDGTPGEIFLSMAKQGSTVSGLMEAFGRAVVVRAPVRRAAAGPRPQLQPHALRADGPHGEPRHPASRSRSSTTSSAGWRAATCRRRKRTTSA